MINSGIGSSFDLFADKIRKNICFHSPLLFIAIAFEKETELKLTSRNQIFSTNHVNMTNAKLNSESQRKIGLVPIAFFAVLYVVYLILGLGETFVYNSSLLLLVLDSLFLTGTGLVVAVVSIRSYLAEGSPVLLFLGMSTTAGGFAAFIAGLSVNISANDYAAIINLGFLFAGSLQFLSAMVSIVGTVPTSNSFRKKSTVLGYSIVVAIIAVTSIFVLTNLAPTFFSPDATLTRHWVLGATTLLFAASCIIFVWQYLRTKSSVLYWYSLALALFAIGLFGSSSYSIPNGVFDWTVRFAQYLAGFYLLAAVIISRGGKGTIGPVYYNWADAFRSDQRQAAAFFSNLAEAFIYCRIITNKKGRPVDWIYLDVNEAYLKINHVKKTDVIGKPVTDVFPGIEEDSSDWITLYGDVALTGKQVTVERYAQVTDKWYHVSSYSPQIGYFISLYEDITQRVKAEQALQQAQDRLREYADGLEHMVEERTKQLQQAERLAAMGQVAGMVGHDIRNPLQTVTSELYLARQATNTIPEGKEKQDILESIDAVQEQVEYIEKIVSDLQDFATSMKPQLMPVDICRYIPQILKAIAVPAKVQVVLICDESMPKVEGDLTFVRRIFTNLINNGIQAIPNGGKLTITASYSRDTAVLTVEDTGAGIPEDIKAKLFTPLFTTKSTGHGLGLPIVKRLVEAMKGTIEFESEEGKGTKFIIRLPLAP